MGEGINYHITIQLLVPSKYVGGVVRVVVSFSVHHDAITRGKQTTAD